jgi:hypothetical protein
LFCFDGHTTVENVCLAEAGLAAAAARRLSAWNGDGDLLHSLRAKEDSNSASSLSLAALERDTAGESSALLGGRDMHELGMECLHERAKALQLSFQYQEAVKVPVQLFFPTNYPSTSSFVLGSSSAARTSPVSSSSNPVTHMRTLEELSRTKH